MRFIVFLSMMTLSFSAIADYFGGSFGTAQLNYDIRSDAYEVVHENGEYSGPILALGGDIDITSNDSAGTNKLFYGLHISRFFFLEFFKVNINNFSATGTVNLNYHREDSSQINMNYDADTKYGKYSFKKTVEGNYVVDASASGTYKGFMDFGGIGVKAVGISPISIDKDFMILGGIGIMKAKSRISSVSNYKVDYSYTVDTSETEPNTKHVTETGYETTYQEESGIIPVFSVGLLYNLRGGLFLNFEHDRYGHPTNKLSIDTYNVGLMYMY